MQNLSEKISRLPNTKFKALFEEYTKKGFRPELIWEIYITSNEVTSWDNLLTYELCLEQNLPCKWKELCIRDYPEMAKNETNTKDFITVDYRKIYLAQPDALKHTSFEGLKDIKSIYAYFNARSNTPDTAVINTKHYILKRAKFLNIIKYGYINFRSFDHNLINDQLFLLNAIKLDGRVLQYVSEEKKNDKNFMLDAIRLNPYALRYASQALKNDIEVVMTAVKLNGLAIKYASLELQQTEKVIATAHKAPHTPLNVDFVDDPKTNIHSVVALKKLLIRLKIISYIMLALTAFIATSMFEPAILSFIPAMSTMLAKVITMGASAIAGTAADIRVQSLENRHPVLKI